MSDIPMRLPAIWPCVICGAPMTVGIVASNTITEIFVPVCDAHIWEVANRLGMDADRFLEACKQHQEPGYGPIHGAEIE